MISESVLRELGATVRTFRTVKGAMLWYRDQLSNRLRTSRAIGQQHVPWSQRNLVAQSERDATFAAIAALLNGVQHVGWLVCWYETTWGDGTYLAEQAGLTRWSFTRRCRKTEKSLREKMESAGLLEE